MRYSLSSYNISVTNVNPGPVKTAFTDTFGVQSKGGFGTRVIQDDTGTSLKHSRSAEGTDEVAGWGYLGSLAQVMVDSLNRRMQVRTSKS